MTTLSKYKEPYQVILKRFGANEIKNEPSFNQIEAHKSIF